MINAGELDKQVTLRSFTRSLDDYGKPIKTYTDRATVWARVRPLRGNEYFEAHKQTAKIDTEIKIRFRRDIRPSWEVMHGLKNFRIVSIINPNFKNEELLIMCEEMVD